MAEASEFDRLVQELSPEERRELLGKIGDSVRHSSEPLREGEGAPERIRFEDEYHRLSFFKKLIILLRSLLSGLERDELVQELLLRDVRRQIEQAYPELLDFTEFQFTHHLETHLQTLKESTTFLREPLDKAVRREKEAFCAFHVGSELAGVQERFQKETDPVRIAEGLSTDDEVQIRKEMERASEGILAAISSDEKEQIYADYRALHSLCEFSFFRFDAALSCFSRGGPTKHVCRFKDIRKPLLSLSAVLFQTQFPPSAGILESLFLFCYSEKLADTSSDIESLLTQSMQETENALSAIRRFNRKVPLLNVMRYITEDINYFPSRQSGGEDWFALLKSHWKRQTEQRFVAYTREARKQKLVAEALAFLGTEQLAALHNYADGAANAATTVRHATSLRFLMSFFKEIFMPKMNRPLRILLISGGFYREDNRVAFTEAYEGLGRVIAAIERLEALLSSSGEIGKRIEAVTLETTQAAARRNQIQVIVHEADNTARVIVEGVLTNLALLVKVIHGILYGEVGGEFDTLSNLSDVGGRENRLLIQSWEQALNWCEKVLRLARGMIDVELG